MSKSSDSSSATAATKPAADEAVAGSSTKQSTASAERSVSKKSAAKKDSAALSKSKSKAKKASKKKAAAGQVKGAKSKAASAANAGQGTARKSRQAPELRETQFDTSDQEEFEFDDADLERVEEELAGSRSRGDYGATDLVDGLGSLFGGVRSLSSSALKLARSKTVDSASKIIQQTPEQLELMARAGHSLRDLRNVMGVSVEEVADAIDLKNPDLLKSVEEGKAALPFELLLRLSSFYARNNPMPFILKYTRTYSPLISRMLEKIGVDKLVIEAEREIQFVQILRSRDAARGLSDEEFKRVHAFTEKAFDMALNFAANEKTEADK